MAGRNGQAAGGDGVRWFAALMASLAECFPGRGSDISQQKIELYWRALGHYGSDALKAAVSQIIKTRTRNDFPTVAEIIEQIEGRVEDRAAIAWDMVCVDVRRQGRYASVKFDDPRIGVAIQAVGGWGVLCDTPESQLQWRKKDFIEAYLMADRTPAARAIKYDGSDRSLSSIMEQIGTGGGSNGRNIQERE